MSEQASRSQEEVPEETPRFQHDCGKCVFLGRYHERDLYFHPGEHPDGLSQTVVARYGDDGPSYTSGLFIADFEVSLHEAKERAIARGLLND